MASTGSRMRDRVSTFAILGFLLVAAGCTRENSAPVEDTAATIETAKTVKELGDFIVRSDWNGEKASLAKTNEGWPEAKIAQRALVKALYDHDGNRGVLSVIDVDGMLGPSQNKNMLGKYIPPDYSHGLQYKYAMFKVNAKSKIIDGTDLEP